MFGIDCHTHTQNSPDGTGTVGGLCRRAISLGLEALAITEHVELNRWHSQGYYGTTPRNEWEEYNYSTIMDRAMKENHSAKEVYGNRLHVISGVEIGQIPTDFGLADSVMQDNRLDFVIASLHEMRNKQDFFCLDYQKESVPALLEQYFSEMLTLCQWGKFDVLGHMTYPLRYIEGEAGIAVSLKDYEEPIHACIKALVDNGCGIELNTSGLRQKYGKTFPTLEYIKLYRELGGESLSIGSDAHCGDDVGYGMKTAVAMAKEAGFSYLCYYLEREPVYIPIP
jgi:histidinol-phosphatase (PHP family)